MPTVYLVDGPCKGTTSTYSDAAVADGAVTCKSATYHLVPGSTGHYLGWVKLPASLTAPVASAPQAAKAWRHVVQALVTTAPADLRKAQAARRHIARIGRRA